MSAPSQAKIPATSRKRVLVMISPEFAHGRAILSGIGAYEEHHGRWQFVFEPNSRPESLLRRDLDGIIAEVRDHSAGEALKRAKVPAIRVTGVLAEDGVPLVTHDNAAVGRLGDNYLADLALTDLAYVANGKEFYGLDRARGFEEACTQRRVRCHMCNPAWTVRKNENRLAQWIAELPKPVGLMASNDRTAFDLTRICQQVGLRIPEQIAILGVDNEEELCRMTDPPLSSIDHDSPRLGYEAAKLLDGWMSTGKPPTRLFLGAPSRVVERQSTELIAVRDAEVRSAIRYIRANTDQSIKTADVLQHVAVCRRTMELRFRKAIGRTIHDEIMRVRIERAKRLLTTSDWSMPQVADACGFACASQLSHVFKREAGQSPVSFRQQFRYQAAVSTKA